MTELPFDLNRIFHSKVMNFDELAHQVYDFQCKENAIFKSFVSLVPPSNNYVFLPVDFFKTQQVICNGYKAEAIFSSSGTTGMEPSTHHVASLAVYQESFLTAFRLFYGNPSDYCILALLPGYLERNNSSLVYMTQKLIELSANPLSGFYLYDLEKLFDTLIQLKDKKVILLGITFALLDFAEQYAFHKPDLIIMETGGMKGRRDEITRNEVHAVLRNAFGVEHIHSEYGMTELLSQAYAIKDGRFFTPPWMKVIITDANDPFTNLELGKTGIINVIDLANIHSCSFIQTADLGKLHFDGSFEVLGRLDNSDTRGCSLMYL